ncbi:MAG: virulence protein E [Bacteroides sp.]|nr:virulence protein E [Bacteroides sp.]
MVDKPFQFYRAPITTVQSRTTMTIKEAYLYITSLEALERTHKLRAIKDEKKRKAYKAQAFDFVLFSGTFRQRKAEALIEHSGLICLDFDHVGNDRQRWALREQLLKDPYFETQLLFTSPSGDGLKWVIAIDMEKHDHLSWFIALQNYIRFTYQKEIDKACKDVCRSCFLPHDASCYVNPIIFNEPDVCPF